MRTYGLMILILAAAGFVAARPSSQPDPTLTKQQASCKRDPACRQPERLIYFNGTAVGVQP